MAAAILGGALAAYEAEQTWSFLFFSLAGMYALHLLVTMVRRVGKTPCCRKCGYNLTGAISGRCPECGQSYESYGYDIGQRRFVIWRLMLGLGLLAYSGVMMALLLST